MIQKIQQLENGLFLYQISFMIGNETEYIIEGSETPIFTAKDDVVFFEVASSKEEAFSNLQKKLIIVKNEIEIKL